MVEYKYICRHSPVSLRKPPSTPLPPPPPPKTTTTPPQPPSQFPQIPLHILERGGSLAIAGVLKVMVPRFVKILSKDYERWSQGDDSRAAVAQDLEERLISE